MNLNKFSRYLSSLFVLFVLLFVLGITLGFTHNVLAKVVCIPLYGGGEQCTETLNKSFALKKEVRRANETAFHENLDDVRDNETLEFRITVKNTGEVAVDKLVVTDFLPEELTILQDQLGWNVLNLKPQEQTELFVKAGSGNLDKLNLGETRCVVNTAEVRYQGEIEASDTSTICLKRGEVLPAEKLPETGLFDEILLPLSFGAITAGLYLRRKYL